MPLCDQCRASFARSPIGADPRFDASGCLVLGRSVGPVAWRVLDLLWRARPEFVAVERLIGAVYGGAREPIDPASNVRVLIHKLRHSILPGTGLRIASSRYGSGGPGCSAYALVDEGPAGSSLPLHEPRPRRHGPAGGRPPVPSAKLDAMIDRYCADPELPVARLRDEAGVSLPVFYAALHRRETETGQKLSRRPRYGR